MSDLPQKTDTRENKFLGFLYPEIKDLAKHFLTLVSGVLVFSVTFSDKIISFENAKPLQKIAIIAAWLLWIVAVIFIGVAIFVNFVTATTALRRRERDIRTLVRITYLALDLGGVCFVAGLFMLAVTALSKLKW